MSNDQLSFKALNKTVEAFNDRRYREAAETASRMLDEAVGRDEVFWMGMHETCRGFELIIAGQRRKAEPLLVAAMEKLRNFGYRYLNLEVTSVLAGIRCGVEEIRSVEGKRKRLFDVSLLPKLKMSQSADAQ